MTSCGCAPSTLQPTDCAVPKEQERYKDICFVFQNGYDEILPRISFTVPSKVLANERGRIIRAILKISSSETLPSCLTRRMKINF